MRHARQISQGSLHPDDPAAVNRRGRLYEHGRRLSSSAFSPGHSPRPAHAEAAERDARRIGRVELTAQIVVSRESGGDGVNGERAGGGAAHRKTSCGKGAPRVRGGPSAGRFRMSRGNPNFPYSLRSAPRYSPATTKDSRLLMIPRSELATAIAPLNRDGFRSDVIPLAGV